MEMESRGDSGQRLRIHVASLCRKRRREILIWVLFVQVSGSKPAHGSLQTLIKAGQASVFRDGGDLVQNAIVKAAIEEGKVVLSIADPNLIRAMFGNRPETVTINTRAVGSNFEVVKVEYRE
jgi:hypothetical protein